MKKKALFVGVNKYEDDQIRDLDYSLSDAHALKTMFDLCGYQTDILENPSKSDVFRAVRKMTEGPDGLTAGDFFFFYFAGHGWTTSTGKHLLFCSDDQYEYLRYDYNVGIPFDILKQCTEAGGYNRAFVLDACRSDFMTGTRGGDATTRDLRPIGELVKGAPTKSSLAVLRSCSQYEHALEIKSRKHGLFTLAMMEVLRSSKEDGKELQFGESLCDSVTEKMRAIAEHEGIVAEQTPEFAKIGIAQVLIEGNKTGGNPKSSMSSLTQVICPECGRHNSASETFKCKICGRDNLCVSHLSNEYKCCDACVESVRLNRRKQAQEIYEKGEDFYRGRNGVVQDYVEAGKWYRNAAERGHVAAQFALGVMYDTGRGVERDYVLAAKWFRMASEQGDADAQANLGKMYANGQGVDQDYAQSLKWFRMAADKGHPDAQYSMGVMYCNGRGVERDFAQAAEWFRKAAEQEYVKAQVNLGTCYRNGDGVIQDYIEAAKWYLKASKHGDATAQSNLGMMYANGQGVDQDEAEAVLWFTKSAEQGYVPSQFSLGVMYDNGRGINQDESQAIKWFRKAAERGYPPAQFYLGKMCVIGRGIKSDDIEAIKWLRRAAEQGFADAQFMLGLMYANGKGVEKDNVKALFWVKKAAMQGQQEAIEFAEKLKRLIECEQVSKSNVENECKEQEMIEDLESRMRDGHKYYSEGKYDKAAKLFQICALAGNAVAQYNLGILYATGHGVVQNQEKAFEWLQKSAKQGYKSAIELLEGTNSERNATGNTKSVPSAVGQRDGREKAKGKTDNYGSSQKLYNQAENYYRGQNGVKEDRAKAFELYQKAAEQGHAEAQYSLGYMYAYGEGVAKNNDKALFWYEKAAAQGHQKAARFLSGLKERIVKEQEEERARAYWERKEEERRLNGAQARQEITQRERDAQFRVEKERQDTEEKMSQAYKSYEDGNYSAAALLWRICAVRGVAAAQYNLGALYATGKGVEQDYAQAIEWLQKGAAQGDEDSQKLLDTIKLRLHQGRQRLQDEKERLQSEKERLLNEKRRLEQENASELEERRRLLQEQGRLLNSLGVRFYNGTHGQRQDYVKAVEHFKKAAEIGNASAQFNIGVCYASGAGVAKNVREAIRWYRKAAENGYDDAKAELRRLGEM